MNPRRFADRLRGYVFVGLMMGTGFCAFLIIPVLRSGFGPIPGYGITPLQVAGVYLGSGLLGGSIVAVLHPITRWFLGSFVLGMIVTFPAYLAFGVLLRKKESWTETIIIGLVLAFFVGGGVGTQLTSESRSRPIPSREFVMGLWVLVALTQVAGWYLGMTWPGTARAGVGLALVFGPPYVAGLATFARRRVPASAT